LGGTPLHVAMSQEKIGVVECLLAHRANVNLKASDGTTALHMAVRFGRTEFVRQLLSKGANPNSIAGPNGKTPLDLAEDKGHKEITTLLRSNGAKTAAELEAKKSNQPAPIKK